MDIFIVLNLEDLWLTPQPGARIVVLGLAHAAALVRARGRLLGGARLDARRRLRPRAVSLALQLARAHPVTRTWVGTITPIKNVVLCACI